MAEERMDAPANMDSGDSSSSDEGVRREDRAAFSAAEAVALAHVDEDRSPMRSASRPKAHATRRKTD